MTFFKINYILEVILLLLKKDMHGRELAKGLKTSLTRVQNILTELSSHNVIDYQKQGRNHIYFLKKNIVSRAYILNAENYKLIRLISEHSFFEPLFMDIITKYPNKMILLFGSYAKFIPKKDSDIDMYVCTEDIKIKQGINKLYHKLSVKIGGFDKEDNLIKEIIKNHIIIQGAEKYYEKLKFFE